MTVINFPGVIPEQTQEEKISNVRDDIEKLEEYLEEAQDYVDGVLLVTFSKNDDPGRAASFWARHQCDQKKKKGS